MTVAHAKCDNCNTQYDSKNAMGLMARHCKKTGHTAYINCGYAVFQIQK